MFVCNENQNYEDIITKYFCGINIKDHIYEIIKLNNITEIELEISGKIYKKIINSDNIKIFIDEFDIRIMIETIILIGIKFLRDEGIIYRYTRIYNIKSIINRTLLEILILDSIDWIIPYDL